MTGESTNAVEVFYSYAQEDESLRKELDKHLTPLIRKGLIEAWSNRNINAGTDWVQEIDAHLRTADIILLLISPDFIASDYSYSVEMKRAMERHDAGEARVIPVILRPVNWRGTPFDKLKALPPDAKPVTRWRDRNEAFFAVAEGIRKAINDLHRGQQDHNPHRYVAKDIGEAINDLHSSPSQQLWNVPYPSNPLFTDRENILEGLRNTFATGKVTAPIQQAIHGLAGIGKTQCALEYAYRYRDKYQAVFWTNANSPKALVAGFVAIAALLQLKEKDAQDQSMAITAVKQWLETNTDWLLILDNADNLKMVYPFLPRKGSGHILLTTSANAIPQTMTSVQINQVDQEKGVLFLLRRVHIIALDALPDTASVGDRARASDIVQTLGNLPLALDQAGAYINATRCGLAGFLHLYQTHRANLLQTRDEPLTYPVEPVATTWDLAFEKVEKANPAAVDLLRLCAFLAPDAIPEEIISVGAPDLGPVLQPVAADSYALNEAIGELLKFSLVDRENGTLTIQRLVQTVLKDGMDKETQRHWAERAVRAVNCVFPDVEVATWPTCQHYLPQAQNCAELIKDYRLFFLEAGRLLYETGRYLFDRAQYAQAEPLYQQALSICRQVLGTSHPDTASILHELARLYQAQGLYARAEALFKEALEICKHLPETEHFQTIDTMQALAWLYKDQAQYEQAKSLFQEVLEILKHLLGAHPDTAGTLHALASLYKDQGQPMPAPLLQEALEIHKQVMGTRHPGTASIMHELAGFYQDQGQFEQDHGRYKQTDGQYKQAESFFKKALEIRQQILGLQHPQTADTLYSLAWLYHDWAWLYKNQDLNDQAESLFKEALAPLKEALEIRQQILAPQHPQTAETLHAMGQFYQDRDQYERAESLLKEALEIREHVLGYQHPRTADNLQALAWLYKTQGHGKQVESLYNEALKIRRQVLGNEHPATATTLFNFAWYYKDQRKYEQAEPLFKEALAIRRRVLKVHPDTATTMFDLAWLYKDQRKYEQAEPLFKEALKMRRRVLGNEHPKTATALLDLAWLYKDQHQYEQAEPLFKEALEIRRRVLGANHPDTVKAQRDLEGLYHDRDQDV